MDIRDRLLTAAAHVFASAGYRGATTRRIAQEAGVNEITLFRHFGSKDALIHEALRTTAITVADALPAEPRDPDRELRAWCRAVHEHLYAQRAIIRTVMGEMEERPEAARVARGCPDASLHVLAGYLRRLRERGLARAEFNASAAAAMLTGVLFADVLGRDIMPDLYGRDPQTAIAEYVRIFLRGLGVGTRGAPAAPTTRTRKS